MLTRGGTVRLQIHSNFDMLDFVQVVSDRLGQMAGMDEDSIHWIGVAVRESVINAIKHGNRENFHKLVTIEFTFTPAANPGELIVRVVDQGEGFDPQDVPDPTAVENLERPCGRGLMLMHHYMCEVKYLGRGNSVRMSKHFRNGKT